MTTPIPLPLAFQADQGSLDLDNLSISNTLELGGVPNVSSGGNSLGNITSNGGFTQGLQYGAVTGYYVKPKTDGNGVAINTSYYLVDNPNRQSPVGRTTQVQTAGQSGVPFPEGVVVLPAGCAATAVYITNAVEELPPTLNTGTGLWETTSTQISTATAFQILLQDKNEVWPPTPPLIDNVILANAGQTGGPANPTGGDINNSLGAAAATDQKRRCGVKIVQASSGEDTGADITKKQSLLNQQLIVAQRITSSSGLTPEENAYAGDPEDCAILVQILSSALTSPAYAGPVLKVIVEYVNVLSPPVVGSVPSAKSCLPTPLMTSGNIIRAPLPLNRGINSRDIQDVSITNTLTLGSSTGLGPGLVKGVVTGYWYKGQGAPPNFPYSGADGEICSFYLSATPTPNGNTSGTLFDTPTEVFPSNTAILPAGAAVTGVYMSVVNNTSIGSILAVGVTFTGGPYRFQIRCQDQNQTTGDVTNADCILGDTGTLGSGQAYGTWPSYFELNNSPSNHVCGVYKVLPSSNNVGTTINAADINGQSLVRAQRIAGGTGGSGSSKISGEPEDCALVLTIVGDGTTANGDCVWTQPMGEGVVLEINVEYVMLGGNTFTQTSGQIG